MSLKAEFAEEYEPYDEKRESFLINLKSDKVKRSLTFKYLADYIERASGL